MVEVITTIAENVGRNGAVSVERLLPNGRGNR
jgi:hypothetical protein